ncbi:MAG: electron transfer flavoprotein alpha subunit [Desulforhopalus sp.]|jgi:electron transfer flavoprotein alpha subunit
MAQGVVVIAEYWNNSFRKISIEAVCEAKRLVAEIGGSVTAVVMGSGVTDAAAELGKYGADRIVVADDAALASFRGEAYANVFCDILADIDPSIVLCGSTSTGIELSARVAARKGVGLANECTAFKVDDSRLVATRPVFGGRAIADVEIAGTPQMATIRPNMMEIVESQAAGEVAAVTVNVGEVKVELVEENIEVSEKVELTEADYVVSGGRGMGSGDFTILEELVTLLGGAIGASRNAVDAGWRPHSDQVGQTGKVVSPKLYLACGISGAMQHTAGISTSNTIVAINNDPDALIFRIADYCIVGDLFEVVPAITNEIKALKA